MSFYAADGSINVTVVDGNTYTGLYASDGSINVVEAPSPATEFIGLYHSCGAYNVTVAVDGVDTTRYAPDGSLFVTLDTSKRDGPVRVTVVDGTIGWVLEGATLDWDFVNGQYFGGTPTSGLSITRTSNATSLLSIDAAGTSITTFDPNELAIIPGVGLSIAEARTNFLLNSTAPATQTTASLATGNYILWVNGTGSAAVSAGTATLTGAGTATNGTPDLFTVTGAGTVTITVTGSLDAFQLELGSFPTPLIVTSGTTAARAADSISITGSVLTKFLTALAGTGSIYLETSDIRSTSILTRVVGTATASPVLLGGTPPATARMRTYNGSVILQTGANTSLLPTSKTVSGWTTGARSIICNGGTLASDANGVGTYSSLKLGSGSVEVLTGVIRRLALHPTSNTAWNGLTS